jgi:hypothetical protein
MKKRKIFRITEEQLAKFMSNGLCEDMNIAYQKPANGIASTTDMKQQITNAKKAAPGAKVNLEVSSDDLGVNEEMKPNTFTKKQLKEARLKMLRETSKAYKKSELMK